MRKHFKILLAATMVIALWLPATSAFAKDRTKPVISEVSSSVKITNKSTSDIMIKYKLSERAKVSIKIYKGTVLVKTGLSKSLKATGRQTFIWKGTKAPGTYIIKIEAIDLSGNVALTKSVSVTIDLAKPVITNLESDDPSNYFTSEMGLYLYFNLSETAKVTARAYGGQFPNGYNIFNDTFYKGENEIDWNAKFGLTKAADGKYRVVLTAYDLAGNISTATIYVTKDDVAPDVKTMGFEQDSFNPNNGPIKFSFTATEPVQFGLAIINKNNPFQPYYIYPGINEETPVVTSGEFMFDGKINYPEVGGNLPDGVYEYNLILYDKAFNVQSVSGTIKIDSATPQLSAVTVPEGLVADGTNKLAINFNLNEDSTVTAVVYKVYQDTETLVKKVIDNVKKTIGISSAEWDGKDDNGNLVDAGNYVLKIFAKDLADNQTDVQTKNFTVTKPQN